MIRYSRNAQILIFSSMINRRLRGEYIYFYLFRRLLISKQHLAPDDAEVKIFLGSEP